MADITSALESGSAPPPPKSGKGGPAAPSDITLRFNENSFLFRDRSTIDVHRTGRKEGEKVHKVEISGQLYERFNEYLSGYVGQLLELQNNPADAPLLTGDDHLHDRRLLSLLTDRVGSGVEAHYVLNPEKVQKFLETPEGWIITIQVQEYMTALKMFAAGLSASMNPAGERSGLPSLEVLRTGRDQGVINRVFQERISHLLTRFNVLGVGGSTVVGTVGGAVLGGPLGAAAGAFLGAGGSIGVYNAVESLRRDGLTIDSQAAAATLRSVKSDPQLSQFVYAMTGVNPRDFQYNAGNIDYVPDRTPESVRGMYGRDAKGRAGRRDFSTNGLQGEIISGILDRVEFYEALGVDIRQLDSVAEQFIFDPSTGGIPELPGTRWARELMTEYNPNDPALPGPTSERIQRFREARQTVMMRYLDRYIQEELRKKRREGPGPKQRLIEKQEKISSGAFKDEREKSTKEQLQKINEAKVKAESEKNSWGVDQLVTAQQEIKAQEKTLQTKPLLVAPAAGETMIEAIDRVALEIDHSLNDTAGTPPGLAQRLRTERNNRSRHIATERQNTVNALRGGRALGGTVEISAEQLAQITSEVTADADELFGGIIADLERQIRDAETRLSTLETTGETYRTKIQEYETAVSEAVVRLPKELTEMSGLFEIFTDTTGIHVNPVELQNRTVADLVDVFSNPPFNLPHATPEQQTMLREIVLAAKTEAIARRQETLDNPNPAQRIAYETALRRGISANELVTLDRQEIVQRLTLPPFSLLPAAAEIMASASIAEAQRRLIRRSKIRADERIKDLDEQIKAQEKKLEDAGDYKEVSSFIQHTATLIDRHEDISLASQQIPDSIDRYTDTTLVDAADPHLTPQEKAEYNGSRLPRGYLEVMNLLFDYRSRGADRGEYFAQIVSYLPPQKLAERIDDALGYHLPTPTINGVLTQLQVDIVTDTINELELRNAIADHLIDYLIEEAEAL